MSIKHTRLHLFHHCWTLCASKYISPTPYTGHYDRDVIDPGSRTSFTEKLEYMVFYLFFSSELSNSC